MSKLSKYFSTEIDSGQLVIVADAQAQGVRVRFCKNFAGSFQ